MNTFKRIPGTGNWGVLVETGALCPGDTVTVQTRNGKIKQIKLGELVERTKFGTLFAIADKTPNKQNEGDEMARTPSMTQAEAEAAIAVARGQLLVRNIDIATRAALRKWYSARGISSAFNGGLSVDRLCHGYNSEDYFNVIRGEYINGNGNAVADVADDEPEEMTPVVAPPKGNGHVAIAPNREQALIEMLREVLGGAVKKEEVQAIVAESLKGVREELLGIVPRKIEINVAGNAPVLFENQHPVFERVVKLAARGVNIMLVGPAGCGKTYLAGQVAKALGREYGFISGSAGVSESALTGWLLPADGGRFEYVPSDFVTLYEKGNSLWCFDEMDAFDNNMLMITNMATANGHFPVPHRRGNTVVRRGENVSIIATCNTYGTGANPLYSARVPLDAATLDRYVIVTMDYDKAFEERVGAAGGLSANEMSQIWNLRDKVRIKELRRVVSTRAFQKAADMKAAGDNWSTVMSTLTEGFTKDEKEKIGIS